MSAVDQLLLELGELDSVVDHLGLPATQGTPAVVATLSRGLAVRGLVAFEQFVRERGAEWSSALTAARIAPAAWPGGRAAIQDRLVEALPRNYRDMPVAQRPILISQIANSFNSLASSSLVSHSINFAWSGSNVQGSDLEAMFQMVGMSGSNAWSEMTSLWARTDPRFPGNVSAKSLFEEVSRLRHDAAHSAQPMLAAANLASITRNVRLLALFVDALMTACMVATIRGGATKSVKGGSIPIRRVERDGAKWREFGPKSSRRAAARHPEITIALTEAAKRANAGAELVIARDGNDIVNWRTVM